jgi:hypothetical protein
MFEMLKNGRILAKADLQFFLLKMKRLKTEFPK